LCLAVALILWWRSSPQDNPDPAPTRTPAPALTRAPFDEQQARIHQDAWARYLGIPVVADNSIGLKLALIPPGRFLMGSPREEAGRDDDEQPHAVTITRPFRLGVCEVTVGQFRTFVEETTYRTEAEATGKGSHVAEGSSKKTDPRINWRNPGFAS